MEDYCQHAKYLADQLQSLGSPVDDRMLVIKVLTGLTEQYDGISTVLQNRETLPSFTEVRSRLNQEETKKKRQTSRAATTAATALAATTTTSSDRTQTRPRGGRGRRRGQPTSNRSNNNTYTQTSQPNHPYIIFPSNWTSQQWANVLRGPNQPNQPNSQQAHPPCPYPSRPSNNSSGILGARPDQAHVTGYSPTDIEQALYTLSLNPPDHGVMDSGASSHSANQQGRMAVLSATKRV
ncbi:hypothetical protein HanHA300_Chr03g0093651 [Helianthus annuus]|nr:hypothetical protein HanHA89_Chr10g0394371 [Helianthus annuus]KAJ0593131.1 hypothetical protein HanHA300_Chr03g0093651 [Helianthus annuus]KAJ0697685.1 hypothetical protein HanLR1_Chr10g0371741 [Helianthus annuus]